MRLPAFLLPSALAAMMLASSTEARADEPPSTTPVRSDDVATKRVRHDPTLFATGLSLAIVGGVGVGVGTALVAVGTSGCYDGGLCGPRAEGESFVTGGAAI